MKRTRKQKIKQIKNRGYSSKVRSAYKQEQKWKRKTKRAEELAKRRKNVSNLKKRYKKARSTKSSRSGMSLNQYIAKRRKKRSPTRRRTTRRRTPTRRRTTRRRTNYRKRRKR